MTEIPKFIFAPTSCVSVTYEFALHEDILNILKDNEDYFLDAILHDDFIWSAHIRGKYGINVEIHYMCLFQMKEVIEWINQIIHETIKDNFKLNLYIKQEEHKDYLKHMTPKKDETDEEYNKRIN